MVWPRIGRIFQFAVRHFLWNCILLKKKALLKTVSFVDDLHCIGLKSEILETEILMKTKTMVTYQ